MHPAKAYADHFQNQARCAQGRAAQGKGIFASCGLFVDRPKRCEFVNLSAREILVTETGAVGTLSEGPGA